MSFSEHLRARSASDERTRRAAPATGPGRGFEEDAVSDPLAALRARARDELVLRLGTRVHDASLTPADIEQEVERELASVLDDELIPLSDDERRAIVAQLGDDVLGYGPLEAFLNDPTVTEIMVNAGRPIWIERDGRLHRTSARFSSDAQLRLVIERIVSAVGRRIDESTPMVDARLADGSRVNAVIPPLALDGPALTIRKFGRRRRSMQDLIEIGTLSEGAAEFLGLCVAGRRNVVVSGGTGTGKTTLLNVLSELISDDERIITIEDAAELQLEQENLVRLESRPPNIEGRGAVAIRDLLRNALRMRPDRIILGEVRGAESIDMLQAMNTGHDGSLSTLHANSPRDAIARIETMALMAAVELPLRAVRDQIGSALDVIVHISRLRDGTRQVTQISEVTGIDDDQVTTADLFVFDYVAGELVPTGAEPAFAHRLAELGIELRPELFARTLAMHAPQKEMQ